MSTQERAAPEAPEEERASLDLRITGMTCASCANRIERKLGKIEGVSARVNLATDSARVSYPPEVAPADLIAAVTAAGYGARLPSGSTPATTPLATPATSTTPASSASTNSSVPTNSAPNDSASAPSEDATDAQAATDRALTRRLVIAAALSIPVVILAMWPGLSIPHNPWWQAALAAPVALWAAWPFHRAAARAARHGASTMDTLVSIGVLTAWGWSLITLLLSLRSTGGAHPGAMDQHYWFETAAVITTFLLLGRWLEGRARTRGKAAFTSLLNLGAKEVAIIRDGVEVPSPIGDLRVGDEFVVRPGEKVATDARVISGASAIDTSLVTGEPVPADVGPGDAVIGGTLNTSGVLRMEATKVGADTLLAHITRLVTDAQTGRSSAQRLADRISGIFVPIVLALAALTLIGWWLVTGDGAKALGAAMAVLVVACPCALGLATPTALVAGVGRGATRGILIKGPQTLEDAGGLTHLILDKTGTLTQGRPQVVGVHTISGLSEDKALSLAAAIERGSEHPLGRAIVEHARERSLALPEATDFTALMGAGARATIDGRTITIGKPEGFEVPEGALTRRPTRPVTSVYLGWEGVARARIDLADPVRPDSAAVIADLRRRGLAVIVATGDAAEVAADIASQVGIDEVHAQQSPASKHALVTDLQAAGHRVGMVGDGVNDAAALAAADVGVAMGAGTDAATEAGDIVLVRGQLSDLPDALTLSERTNRVIRQNLAWAFGYNLVAIPLAISGHLNPMVAGAAMAASSVIVVANSLRLRWA